MAKNLVADLSSKLSNHPYKVQLAISANWEKSWKLNPTIDNYTDKQIKKFVNVADGHTVAIEVFYKDQQNQDVYFGIRYSPRMTTVTNPEDFVKKVLSLVMYKKVSFVDLINELAIQPTPPNRVMLGVVDYWLTYGPCEIWKVGDPSLTEYKLDNLLKNHPNLVENKDNYTGLEFVYKDIATHWLSFQVSNKSQDKFKLDKPRVLTLSKKWTTG